MLIKMLLENNWRRKMRKSSQCILILLVFAICLCCGSQAEEDYVWAQQANGLRFFEKNGKIGVLAKDGSVLFEPIYDDATYFDKKRENSSDCRYW